MLKLEMLGSNLREQSGPHSPHHKSLSLRPNLSEKTNVEQKNNTPNIPHPALSRKDLVLRNDLSSRVVGENGQISAGMMPLWGTALMWSHTQNINIVNEG